MFHKINTFSCGDPWINDYKILSIDLGIIDLAKEIFQDHLEKQDDSSRWKNVPENELMSYVEEIEDDIIFYPEEAPGTLSHL